MLDRKQTSIKTRTNVGHVATHVLYCILVNTADSRERTVSRPLRGNRAGEVEKRAVIWDTSNEYYKDKNKKNAAWDEICSTLSRNYKTECPTQKKLILQDIISKWRSIRDNYIRSLKKQTEICKSCSGIKKMKPYIYGNQLSFLKKNKELQHTDDNSKDNIQKVIQYKEISDAEEDTELNIHGTSISTTSVIPTKRKRFDIERSLMDFMYANMTRKSPVEEDEDLAFFYSLLSSVKTLTADQKFIFRLKIMQYLQNLKN
ncbi:uncharacterized protein LOC124949854 isoform X1 [Vespa velutina]|uniref:uncharacterized protein LOC124949854 isoform X1 n=1 Tax=Vespa velutina TaxID=202808 RepID=UPI001FB45073|nr:uncharacterized protein LOC124949854 isoform X1 [Vespa velutina]